MTVPAPTTVAKLQGKAEAGKQGLSSNIRQSHTKLLFLSVTKQTLVMTFGSI
jgi:hypothetical protein